MKKKTVGKLVSLITVCLLGLSVVACGNGGGGVSGNTVSGQNADGVLIDHDMAASSVVMSIEDIDITLEDFYLYMTQYLYVYSVTPEKLATPELVNSACDAIVNEIKLETVEYKLAIVEEVEPDPVALSDSAAKAESFYNYFGADFFNTYGISREKVDELFEKQVYIDALKEYTLNQLADDYEADYKEQYADMQCFSIYYVLFPSVQYDEDKVIVLDDDGACIPLTEDELAEQYAKAEELRDKALENIANGEEDGNLEELAVEYGVDHVSNVQRGYMGEYSQELNDLVAGMENGDISDVVKTDAGYMVVRMDNNDDTEFRDFSIRYMAEQSAATLYNTVQDNWMTSSGVADLQPDAAVLQDLQIMSMSTYLTTNGLTMEGVN